MAVQKDPASKEIRNQQISVLEKEYQSLDSIKGNDLPHTKSNLKIGRTTKAEFKAVLRIGLGVVYRRVEGSI
jgi:hypothetical protein